MRALNYWLDRIVEKFVTFEPLAWDDAPPDPSIREKDCYPRKRGSIIHAETGTKER